MANRFTNRKNYDFEKYMDNSLKLNNNFTDVFLGALAYSSSAIAETTSEKDLALWLACRDQEITGRGAVGFDISEIPWSKENFHSEIDFMVAVVKHAKAEGYWKPHASHLYEDGGLLDKFLELLQDFEIEFVIPQHYESWQDTKPGYDKCLKHDVFLNWAGCIICNQAE